MAVKLDRLNPGSSHGEAYPWRDRLGRRRPDAGAVHGALPRAGMTCALWGPGRLSTSSIRPSSGAPAGEIETGPVPAGPLLVDRTNGPEIATCVTTRSCTSSYENGPNC